MFQKSKAKNKKRRLESSNEICFIKWKAVGKHIFSLSSFLYQRPPSSFSVDVDAFVEDTDSFGESACFSFRGFGISLTV